MSSIKRSRKLAVSTSSLLLAISVTFVLSGCGSNILDPRDSQVGTSESASVDSTSVDRDEPNSPQETYVHSNDQATHVGNAPSGERLEADIASNTQPSKPAVKTVPEDGKWSAELPQLLGLSIDAPSAAVIRTYGKPTDEYELETEDETLTMMEYAQFTVGVNDRDEIRFIEVYGAKAATGLNGLRIGDDKNAALEKLGKPDTDTGSVLNYRAEEALLKVDLDPKTKRIISVKLFVALD